MLSLINVTFQIKKQTILTGISIQVPIGSYVVLLGSNGVGKSTLLSLCAGYLKPTTGEIKLSNQDIRVGYVPADLALFPELSVLENLRFFCRLYQVTDIEHRISNLLAWFELENIKNKSIGILSTGMAKRVSMLASLLHDPNLIILDEPTTAIDFNARQVLLKDISKRHQSGNTIIMATHHLDEPEQYATHIGLMQHGHMRAFGPKNEVLGKHQCLNIPELLQKYA